MVTAVLVIALVIVISKWLIYRLSLMAILLYYAEHGQELPNQSTIQQYQMKVLKKLGRGDRSL